MIALFLFGLVVSSSSSVLALNFDAKPDHPDKVVKELTVGKHRYACEFEFVCSGGSLEAWDIDVLATSSLKDGKQSVEVECVVMRQHPPSYLLFSEFVVTLKGPKHMNVIETDVFDNDGQLTEGTAFELHKRKVRNVAGWKGIVNKIVLIARADE
jgi:hypothetical protein